MKGRSLKPARTRGRIAALPEAVRIEINRRLRDGWRFTTIRKWLFEQKAEKEVPDLKLQPGELYSLAWTRTTKNERIAQITCEMGLGSWFQTGYPQWLKEEFERDETIRVVKYVEHLTQTAGEKSLTDSRAGGNVLLRSLLVEAILAMRKSDKDPVKIAQLANAWAQLDRSATQGERAKLSAQAGIDAGLDALYAEAKESPQALEFFNQFRAAVKRASRRKG